MNEKDLINYNRIAQTIEYLSDNFKQQPNLEIIADQVNLSPFHFQRLFSDWAGTSPKNFIQYLTVEYAKNLLKKKQATLFDTALESGLSGTGRLHDLFIKIEGMTPADYKKGGEGLVINYSFSVNRFGKVLIASTEIGICHLAFYQDEIVALETLKMNFPNARLEEKTDKFQHSALNFFELNPIGSSTIQLHLKGTEFQLKVWEALLKIPSGELSTYGKLAENVNNSKVSRAVGTAIGKNPVAFLIPCHRVIQSNGLIGEYMWGSTRKKAIIAWEAANKNNFL